VQQDDQPVGDRPDQAPHALFTEPDRVAQLLDAAHLGVPPDPAVAVAARRVLINSVW